MLGADLWRFGMRHGTFMVLSGVRCLMLCVALGAV